MTSPPRSTYTRDEFFAELDALGEEKVRERLAVSFYGNTAACLRAIAVLIYLLT